MPASACAVRPVESYNDRQQFDTDDTIQEAGICTLEVLRLSNSQNVGFGSAANQGAKVAEGDVLVLLNPDTIATVGSLDKLADALRADTVGAAGGLPQKGLHRSKAHYHRKHARRSLAVLRASPSNPWNVRYRCLNLDYQTAQEIEQPAGACLALKHQSWDAIN